MNPRARQQTLQAARAAQRAGDLEQALRLFAHAGALVEGATMLASHQRYEEAAHYVLDHQGLGVAEIRQAHTSGALDREARKQLQLAASYAVRAGEVDLATDLYMAIGEHARARELLERIAEESNEIPQDRLPDELRTQVSRARARRARATGSISAATPPPRTRPSTGPGVPRRARRPSTGSNASGAAAERLEGSGDLEGALVGYERLGRFADAARMAQRLGRWQEAATLLSRGGLHMKAAACWLKAAETGEASARRGLHQRALDALMSVEPTDHRYDHACRTAIGLAERIGALGYRATVFLGPYVKRGARMLDDVHALYRLARVYEQQGVIEQAHAALSAVVAADASYRDAQQRLDAVVEQLTGRDVAEIERVLEDEAAFRGRGTGPLPVLDASSGALPELPELPDLPDLVDPTPQPDAAPLASRGPAGRSLAAGLAADLRAGEAEYSAALQPQRSRRSTTEPPLAIDPAVREVLEQGMATVMDSSPDDGSNPYAAPGRPAPQSRPGKPPPSAQRTCQAEPSYPAEAQRASVAPPPAESPAPPPTPFDSPAVNAQPDLSAPPRFESGMVVAQRYRLGELLGQGGMARIFRALDEHLDEEVALKVLLHQLQSDEAMERFRRELKVTRKLTHRNVIRVHDIGIDRGFAYISMELLVGRSLHEIIELEGAIDIGRGLGFLMQACAGLQVAHDIDVVHRDVKPENLFVAADDVLKVMDFGLAKHEHAPGITAEGITAGTPEYMAPEQIRAFGQVGPTTDIYALGVVAYRMFTGRVPFQHAEMVPLMMMHINDPPVPPRQINPQIPVEVEALVLEMLAKDPAQRPSSCTMLRRRLRKLRQAHANAQR